MQTSYTQTAEDRIAKEDVDKSEKKDPKDTEKSDPENEPSGTDVEVDESEDFTTSFLKNFKRG